MNKATKLAVLITVALLWINGRADTWSNPTFRWENPSEYTDGAPFTAANVGGYRFYCNGLETIDVPSLGVLLTEYTVGYKTFSPGQNECSMTVYDTNGMESVASASVPFVVDTSTPDQVINFSVER